MREIEFRGIDKLTENWVYGNLVTTIYKGGWVTAIQEEIEDEDISIYESLPVRVIFDSKTIGQYTGFKDKNGKKIFEGDILKHKFGSIRKVSYKNGAFVLSYENSNIEDKVTVVDWEVIGNIYENKDLLEG